MKNINKKNTIKIIFIIGTILMLTSAIIVLLEKTILNNNKIKSFFLLENFKYAIYRTDGKKVTDFKYKYNNGYYSKFRNGYAPVRYLDDEYAIVDENGKEVIKKVNIKKLNIVEEDTYLLERMVKKVSY